MARTRLPSAAKALAAEKRAELDAWKSEHDQLVRPDFLWHYLLQSFATMGRAAGWHGLTGNQENYNKVRYEALTGLKSEVRALHVEEVCKTARIRMPSVKARYILGCFERVRELGGLEVAKQQLLNCSGRADKIEFLRAFPGIGPKYAHNIMMDVYHEDFRDSITIDARIKSITNSWRLSFESYEAHEHFYLSVAAEAGLNGWELDRLMFNFKNAFLP